MASFYVVADMYAWLSIHAGGVDYKILSITIWAIPNSSEPPVGVLSVVDNTPLLVMIAIIVFNVFIVWYLETKKKPGN